MFEIVFTILTVGILWFLGFAIDKIKSIDKSLKILSGREELEYDEDGDDNKEIDKIDIED